MFRKLLKHDIKESYLEIAVLNGLLLGFSLIALLGAVSLSTFLLAIGMLGWGLVFLAVFFVLLSTVIKNFHTRLFTNQGYLTLTTPVSIDKILISKILVSIMWILATVLSVLICVMIVATSFLGMSGFNFIGELWRLMRDFPLEIFKSIFYGLGYVLNFITSLFFVLTLVNTGRMKQAKTLKGILLYIGLSLATSYIGSIFLSILLRFDAFHLYGLISFILNLGWSTLFYFVGRHLIIRKLELE